MDWLAGRCGLILGVLFLAGCAQTLPNYLCVPVKVSTDGQAWQPAFYCRPEAGPTVPHGER